MKTLYLDCFSGASGDMLLGALIDAGLPLDEVRRALGSLALSPEIVWTERVARAGVTATKFCVRGEDAQVHAAAGAPSHARSHSRGHEHSHEHSHAHDHADDHVHQHGDAHQHDRDQVVHSHRTLAEIAALIDRSALSRAGKDRARQLFVRLGEAEAAIHGTSLDRVHLHEVGALDSIIDIVGSVFALEQLQVERIVSSPLNVGSGSIRSAHGLYPVPAPATLRLLAGAPVYSGPQPAEMVTPTGALLVTSYAQAYGPVPAMRVSAIGYGAGTRDFHDTPNVLRVIIGESDAAAAHQTVVVLEAEIDDMNPQIFGVLMDRLLGQGALDVFYTAIQMKKGRPGTLVTVIAPPEKRALLTGTIFRETTTIGVRYRDMSRECLDREVVTVETAVGPVRVKVARRGGEIVNVSPEFEDCLRLANELGRPVKEIQALASTAYLSR
ncbi:MAG TPA: nickel pincer cofactor biosynthesis protein LarC [Vicinamibacterales bacterium]|nr:nickel pincer cofactor biosynthesis protein LarC [Vicinamibacterales bacterium]